MAGLTIGSHISSAGGYEAMGKRAVKMNANTFAFFTRNPRGGKAKEIQQEDVERYKEISRQHEFGKIVAHAPYTMNACAAKEDLREFAKNILTEWQTLNQEGYAPIVGKGGDAGLADFSAGKSAITLGSTASLKQILQDVNGKFEVGTAY